MEKNIFLFAESGGLFFVMFMLFFIGLAIKVSVGLIYDNAIEKAILFQDKSPVASIIYKYSVDFSKEKMCKNTKAFVDNELHNWKICGIFVERFNDIGNIISGFVLLLCIVFDMILLLENNVMDIEANSIMKYIYFYTMISAIMLIVSKGFDTFINIKNKRIVLRDKIVNYLDNNCGAEEYAMIKANIYIDKEGTDTAKEKMKADALNTEDDNAEANGQGNIEGNKQVNTQSNEEVEDKKINNKDMKQELDVLQKDDKEKVIEQVLEEFLA